MIEGARSRVVLASADEPAALAAFAAHFGPDDDATLVIPGPVDTVLGALAAAGVDPEHGPDMLALDVPGAALEPHVDAVLTDRPHPCGVAPRDAASLRDPLPVLPVVMCVWQRVERLPETLALLAAQRGVRPELHLWVNDAAAGPEAERLAAAAPFPARVTVSAENLGGFARFLVARELPHPYVAFIDDDQVFGPQALRTLLAEAAPRTVVSQWAYQLACPANYWHRRLPEPGDWAQYCGTGGMICPTGLFAHEALFACPPEFRFVEDLWLSHVAEHELGYALRRSAAGFEQVVDGRDQYKRLGGLKSEFLRFLVGRGWRVPARPVPAACACAG